MKNDLYISGMPVLRILSVHVDMIQSETDQKSYGHNRKWHYKWAIGHNRN